MKTQKKGKDAAMSYSTYLCVTMATLLLGTPVDAGESAEDTPDLDEVLKPILERIQELIKGFRGNAVSPLRTCKFEKDLQEAARELARVTTQWTYNHLEPAAVPALPNEVEFESSSFR